jgi:transposase
MYLHANAKLGLAGRLALVHAVEQGLSLKAAAAAFSVSPATAHRWWHRWLDGGRQVESLVDRSSRPHRVPRLLAAELQERICDCRRQTGWGPRLVAGATGFAHSTVWKVLHRHGLSRRPTAVKEPANKLRVALSGRAAAHGHQPLRALPAARASRHRRPLAALAQLDALRDEGRLRLRTRDRRRPLEARLRRTPRRREGRDRHRLRRASAHLLRRARHRREAADDRQRLQLRQEPLAARPARHPPPHHRAVPAAHQRESRAHPPDDGTRMGIRPRLPQPSTPQPKHCHTGSTPTTTDDHTAQSATGHQSAAFTTSVGRTAS